MTLNELGQAYDKDRAAAFREWVSGGQPCKDTALSRHPAPWGELDLSDDLHRDVLMCWIARGRDAA